MDNAIAATEEKVVEYRLRVTGLFGRNRKAKADSVHLEDVPYGTTLLDIPGKVEAKLKELKAKPGLRWFVIATNVTIKREGGVAMRSFMMFSGVKVLEGQVAP
jgi:hypothetical protein